MEKSTIKIIKLTASKEHVLTDGEAYGKEIYLGCNDSADNWSEITDAEYAEIVKQQEEEMKGEDI